MRPSKLSLSLAVVLALTLAFLWRARGSDGGAASTELAAGEAAPEVIPTFADVPHAAETSRQAPGVPARASSPRREAIELWAPPQFEYELEVRAFDELDEPVRDVRVFLAPAGHTPNSVGSLGREGKLVVRWLAFTPRMALDVSIDGDGSRRVEAVAGCNRIALSTPGGVPKPVLEARERRRADGRGEAARAKAGTSESRGANRDFTSEMALQDSEGRVQFVEPLLYARAERAMVSGAERLGHPRRFPDVVGWSIGQGGAVARPGILRGRLLDAAGEAVVGAPVFADSWQLAVTGESGEYSLELDPGSWDLRAGGGEFGRAVGRVEVASDQTVEWSPTLDRGLEFKGRLVDARGIPLAGWGVLVETLGGPDPGVDTGTTDHEGRFALPNLSAPQLRLFARGPGTARGSELFVGGPLVSGGPEETFALAVDAAAGPASLLVRVAAAEDTPLPVLWACTVRADTGGIVRGVDEFLSEGPSDALGEFERVVGVRGLATGWYTLVLQSEARAPVFLENVFVPAGSQVQLPTLTAVPPARLRLPPGDVGPEFDLQFELIHRGESVELHFLASDLGGATGFLRPGDYQLVRTNGFETSVGWLHAEPGAVIELD